MTENIKKEFPECMIAAECDRAFRNCMNAPAPGDMEILKEYFSGYDYQGATYTFLANYAWKDHYDICWEIIGDYLCMASMDMTTHKPSALIAMPLTRTGTYEPEKLRETLLECRKRFEDRGIEFEIYLVPGHMVHLLEEAFPGELEFEHDRDYDEYVYEKEKLITLSGRALHKKKNHLNFFLKNYEYEVRKLTKEMYPDIIRISEMVRNEHTRSDGELRSLAAEKDAISEFLCHVDDPDIYSVGIFIDGVMQAYAIGERLSSDTAVEHFEKANIEIRGLYQAVCSEFCKALPDDIIYVNREEDMGIENLRHAKLSLRPHHMAEKFSGWFK